MRLRTRLVVAFLVLSVVPLGAVTYYSYTSQVRALREVASREADALSTDMTQRMQLVTTELSSRVEQLVDMTPVATPRPVQPKAARPAAQVATVAPAPAPDSTVTSVPTSPAAVALTEARVSETLGAAAMLLRSVEFQGMRRGGGSRPPGDPSRSPDRGSERSPDRGNAPRLAQNDPRSAEGGPRFPRPQSGEGRGGRGPRPAGTPRPSPPLTTVGLPSAVAAGAQQAQPTPATAVPQPAPIPGGPAPPPPPGAPIAPVTPGTVAAPANERIVIDMGAITRDMYRKYVPEGVMQNMTSEQRQQMARDINQRVMGIAEGIRLSAAELQKKAKEVEKKSAPLVGAVPLPSAPPAPAPTRTAAKPSAKAATSATVVPAPKMTRTSTLVGNKLDVKVSQDGKVVSQANATIDLENVLATVFSPTRRERGEVAFAVGPDGHLYTATDADRRTVENLGTVARPDGPMGKTVLPDWVVFTQADPSGSGLRFGIARPVGDSLDALKRTAGRNAGLGLLLISLAIVGVVPLSGRLTRNLTALTEGVDRISHGDYRARVPVRSKDEIGELAVAFNKMAEDVEHHQQSAVEQERLRRELELGRQIQNDMLPREPMMFGLSEVQGVSIPAREVGGDFFNYFALENGHVALIVGDVSGKGVGAALLMANIQASLRTRLALGQSLADIAEAIDRDLAGTATTRLYVTLFLGVFDPATRGLSYVNAGHNPQFVLRPNQPIESMEATGIPIGLLAGRGYSQRKVNLASGDLLFFYTDGCVETENESDEMFGNSRLETLLVSIATMGPVTPERVLQQVEQSVTAFRGTREPFDDATMMAVRIG
ncbi:MAG TPA: SpoIIE family protein phosphatase [Vicinamibacterales bacterium]|nr:SpoIIE family protein phosphatase [Vicinamibacterales bacterium]